VDQDIIPIGRLVGKDGKIIKNVEKRLNAKVRIYDVRELRSEIYTLLWKVLSVL
jgi:KH domain.